MEGIEGNRLVVSADQVPLRDMAAGDSDRLRGRRLNESVDPVAAAIFTASWGKSGGRAQASLRRCGRQTLPKCARRTTALAPIWPSVRGTLARITGEPRGRPKPRQRVDHLRGYRRRCAAGLFRHRHDLWRAARHHRARACDPHPGAEGRRFHAGQIHLDRSAALQRHRRHPSARRPRRGAEDAGAAAGRCGRGVEDELRALLGCAFADERQKIIFFVSRRS